MLFLLLLLLRLDLVPLLSLKVIELRSPGILDFFLVLFVLCSDLVACFFEHSKNSALVKFRFYLGFLQALTD